MATKLEYFYFIATFFAFAEQQLNELCWSLYGILRKHVPSVCVPIVAKTEERVAAAYSTLRLWTSEAGMAVLTFADQKVDASIKWTGTYVGACGAHERYKTVRGFWSAIAARISETWQNHGMLVGTMVALTAMFNAILELILKIWHSPSVQAFVDVVRTSPPVQSVKSYYDANVQPFVTHRATVVATLVQKAAAALSGPLDSVRECISSLIDKIVGTVYYGKFYDGAATTIQQLKTTGVYKKVEEKAAPFVGPTWEKIRLSDFYANLVDKFTPIKEE